MHTRTLRLLSLLSLLACASAPAPAQSLYWNPTGNPGQQGGSGPIDATTPLWNTSSVPTDSLVAWSNGSGAVFGGDGGTITGSGATLAASTIDFQSDYTLAGSLTFSQGVFSVSNLSTLVLTGSLSLSGTTSASDTAINQGAIDVNGGALSSAANGYLGLDGSGYAELNVSGGGSVAYNNTLLGTNASSYSFATVTGSGSTLSNAQSLIVGNHGYGGLTISGGGTVTSVTATLGRYIDEGNSTYSTGSVSVSGAGSSWSTTGADSLIVGDQGNGYLTVADGGMVNVTGGSGEILLARYGSSVAELRVGNGAASGGVQAAAVSGGSGDAAVIFNHTDSAAVFSPLLNGTLRVEHLGAGTTILTNANTHTGGTRIVDGTLVLGNYNALGGGPVTMEGGTLDLDGFSQYEGYDSTATFTLAGNAFIDFSGGGNSLSFADSSALEWSGSLTITGFTAGDNLSFGSSATGLTPEQLAMINFDGYTALIDNYGGLSASTTAIPEPSTYAALAGLAALGAVSLRRRRLTPA